MSKRKVQFAEDAADDDALGAALQGAGEAAKKQKETRFKEKHSLDSDEEDNEDKYDVMAEDDIEGQEDGDVDFKDGVEVTPFNMKEELEDGHFDSDGTYIFNKDKEIKDSWLDNIDWIKVTERPVKEDSDSDQEPEKVAETPIFQQMLDLMKPGENVIKALKRLGGDKSSMSASQRWKKKKNTAPVDPQKEAEEKENKEKLLKLTECADKLLQQGNMDIYQDTYEKLQFTIKGKKATEEDEVLDMFADTIDKKVGEEKKSSSENNEPENKDNSETNNQPSTSGAASAAAATAPAPAAESSESKETSAPSDEVKWEYKWEEADTELHGPFTSTQMMEWQEDDYFKDGVLVRRCGTKSFYSSKRVDFELYT